MDPLKDAFAELAGLSEEYLPEGLIKGLVGQGVIMGVGNVLVFVPQIAILFGFIAVLEDCGYMGACRIPDGPAHGSLWAFRQVVHSDVVVVRLCNSRSNGDANH